jgi:4-hydroxy-3-methylbut-2-en-1-yl diphosphate reductase
MQIIRADAMGMCFGVKDALRITERVAEPTQITIQGQLVHNPVVNAALRARGFRTAAEARWNALPETQRVLITAHGISNAQRLALERAGKELIDTTCPLVRRAHEAALKLQRAGFHVLVIGRAEHVEVRGLVGDLVSYDVIETAADVRRFEHARLGIICQTTSVAGDVRRLRADIAAANPHAEIRFMDTVCQPTKDRQQALVELLSQVDVMVVVGGAHSNNTRQLVQTCRAHGVTAFHVESAADVQAEWFVNVERVGLTAGTSTLDATVDAVEKALMGMEVLCRSGGLEQPQRHRGTENPQRELKMKEQRC